MSKFNYYVGIKMKKILLAALLSTLSSQSFAVAPAEPVLTSEVKGVDVSFSWPKIQDAAGYAFYYTQAPFQGLDDVMRIDQGNSNSFAVPLYPGADYLVAIKAYNSNQEESKFSNVEQVTISQAQVAYMALNRQRYNGLELKEGVFQMLVDLDKKTNYSTLELFAPDEKSYGQFTIKDDNQAEIYITDDLATMEPFLLKGEYRIGNEAGSIPVISLESDSYPSFPEIMFPVHNATNVGKNPVIKYTAMSPATISITDLETNKEVFFSQESTIVVDADGSKSIKIDNINLKPDTRYLLEINSIKKASAKGSTSAIAFSTK
jgi:hypothetical protein